MAANTSPIFTLVPNIGFARLIAANTVTDGSGTLNTVFTSGANGSLCSKITFTSAQATQATSSTKICRIFITDVTGANPRLYREVLLNGAAATTIQLGASVIATFTDGLILKAGQSIKVAISVYAGAQDQTDAIAEGGDY